MLVVDDHAEVLDLLRRALGSEGHQVETATTVASARAALAVPPDVLVLDVGLPDGSGVELCRELRHRGMRLPILLLTAQSDVPRRVAGLEAGADDYLAKPFAVAELRARVRALGRRGPLPRPTVVQVGDDVELDLAGRQARLDGTEVAITAREWSVLELLASRSGRVVSRETILDSIWGDVSERASASLDVIVGRIRRKLRADVVRTVRGMGYALGPG